MKRRWLIPILLLTVLNIITILFVLGTTIPNASKDADTHTIPLNNGLVLMGNVLLRSDVSPNPYLANYTVASLLDNTFVYAQANKTQREFTTDSVPMRVLEETIGTSQQANGSQENRWLRVRDICTGKEGFVWRGDVTEIRRLDQPSTNIYLDFCVEYIYDNGVSESTVEEIRQGLRAGFRYANQINAPLPGPFTIYAYRDVNRLAAVWVELTGEDITEVSYDFQLFCGKARALDQSIFLYVQEDCFDNDRQSIFVVTHEYFHLIQFAMFAEGGQQQLLNPSRWGPLWLIEGSAELFSARALDSVGLRSYDNLRDTLVDIIYRSGTFFIPSVADSPDAIYNSNAPTYLFSLLASERLDPSNDMRRVITFYDNISGGFAPDPAFRDAFGMSIGDFDEVFIQHQQAGFPRLR